MTLTTDILLQNLASGLLLGLIYALVAAGLAMIYGLMEFVNFAHGEFLMMSMYAAYWADSLFGIDPLFALPGIAILLFLMGMATYLLVIQRLLHAPMVTQMFATFGLSIFLRSLAQFLWSADFRLIQDPIAAGRYEVANIFISRAQVIAGAVAIVAFGALWFIMQRTTLGLAMRATAQDRKAAQVMGIDTHRINLVGWGIAMGLVGIAGTLLSNITYVGPYIGASFGANAFVAVALGGFGSVRGAFIGALIVGVVENLTGLFISPSLKTAVVFTLYIVVVLIRPRGLMGRY